MLPDTEGFSISWVGSGFHRAPVQIRKTLPLRSFERDVETKHIFVFTEHALYTCPLTGSLDPAAELDAMGWEINLAQAIRRIQEFHPPAVIIACQNGALDCAPAAACIRAACPGIHVSEINLESGVVRIHCGETPIVQELRLLFSAVDRLGVTRKKCRLRR